MKEGLYPKMKIPSSRQIEKRESKEHRERERQFTKDINLKTASIQELRDRARDLRRQCTEKQQEMQTSEKMYRIQAFKNQNYKSQVNAFEKKSQSVRIALAQRLIDQYKGNQESPLFYNENGLSPFQLLLLQYSRNDSYSENICMICYMDIEMNSHIVKLPCSHVLHRDCAVQHLLYAKSCPGCTKEIVFQPIPNKFIKQ